MPAVGLILLAAGASSRMGMPKQLLRFQGESLLRRAAESALASACRPVVVVLGANADKFRPELVGMAVHCTENLDWEQGMGSSIRAGMKALLAETQEEPEAVILMLCDQPLLTVQTLTTLLAAHEQSKGSLIASEYGETVGVPALFPRAFFAELLALNGAEGAKQIIHRHREQTIVCPFPEGTVDVDTPEDFARLRAW